jgi:hypothetical protein
MSPKEYLIEKGLPSWMAKFMVKKIASSLNENKYKGMNSDIDKPLGKDVFVGK